MMTNLRHVHVPILEHTVCKNSRMNIYHNVTERMLCAGFQHGTKDACQVEAPNTIATPSSVATGNVSYGIPSDIAQIGEPIEQVVLDTYPKQHNRAFVSDWFKRYKWLQYSVEKDAAFAIHASNFTSWKQTDFVHFHRI
ncbi:Trypsin-2 [Eumeta japonica]|uniref:Trypsin-2 n=1 Tax=Eumeta variegata TaxID=151549 RepID=A0A4C1SDJ6_EUMVA|nr:Trypsin-2 [Eumeta japonica]